MVHKTPGCSRRAIWVAAILVSAGFFGVAHVGGLVWLLYAGVTCLVVATLVTGVGLVRAPVRA